MGRNCKIILEKESNKCSVSDNPIRDVPMARVRRVASPVLGATGEEPYHNGEQGLDKGTVSRPMGNHVEDTNRTCCDVFLVRQHIIAFINVVVDKYLARQWPDCRYVAQCAHARNAAGLEVAVVSAEPALYFLTCRYRPNQVFREDGTFPRSAEVTSPISVPIIPIFEFVSFLRCYIGECCSNDAFGISVC